MGRVLGVNGGGSSDAWALQSKKLFECLRGAGGATRLVMLPYEGHGYLARESVEHVIYEVLEWFDK